MTETKIVSPDGAAFGSTPDECRAAKIEAAAKLDQQREFDRKREEAPKASDAPRRARKLGVAATVAALLAVLGIGWGAGLKTRELMNLAQASTWFQDTAGALMSSFDAQRKQIIAGIEGLASTPASQAPIRPNGVPDNKIKTPQVIESEATQLIVKMDQLRASSARAISDLGSGIERLNGSMERSQRDQREILAKLDQLQGRLERLENQSAGASSTRQAQPLEKPVAAQPAPPPLQPSAPSIAAGAPKPTTAPAQIKRIENWAVMEVVDGRAILEGPRGIIEVSSGDVVPGVGRVDSISRRGGRWVVATSKGVITGR
jgi:hypothetical protein